MPKRHFSPQNFIEEWQIQDVRFLDRRFRSRSIRPIVIIIIIIITTIITQDKCEMSTSFIC
jgi:hypothetical protein